MPDIISPNQFHERAEDLIQSGWRLSDDGKAIRKTFQFVNFTDAIAFMMRVSFDAEAQFHHPEWHNVFNKVDVRLTTHDSGGLTGKDLGLARAMEAAL